MAIDITEIVNMVLALLATVITTFLLPWLKSKTTEQQQQMAKIMIECGVRAAEQLYYSGEGQEKKQFVLDYLEQKGIKVDDAQIEATVHQLFGTDQKNDAWDGTDEARGE